jgi:hypothetical protein
MKVDVQVVRGVVEILIEKPKSQLRVETKVS